MKLQVKRIDTTLPLPEYKTKGACAFDLYVRETVEIAPKTTALLPNNIVVKIPDGYTLLVCSRSSTPKRGLLIPHGFGLIDRDYCGEKDELMTLVYNFSDETVRIERGERVSQGLLIPSPEVTIEEVTSMSEESRGGFGTTN